MSPEKVDPYGFHEMLVKLGHKHLPQRHRVLDFYQPYDRDAWDTRIISDEFDPKFWQVPVSISGFELLRANGKEQILNLLKVKFEIAFMCLRYYMNQEWNRQVMPADVPSGE
jgi:hypothetical protein